MMIVGLQRVLSLQIAPLCFSPRLQYSLTFWVSYALESSAEQPTDLTRRLTKFCCLLMSEIVFKKAPFVKQNYEPMRRYVSQGNSVAALPFSLQVVPKPGNDTVDTTLSVIISPSYFLLFRFIAAFPEDNRHYSNTILSVPNAKLSCA